MSKLAAFLARLQEFRTVEQAFDFVVEDISGCSYVENPSAPTADPLLQVEHFKRTAEQDAALGLTEQESPAETQFDSSAEVLQFPTTCSNCGVACSTNMKTVDIPHFRQVILMATNCSACGYRNNEVKPSEGIRELGRRIELSIGDDCDLNRDVVRVSGGALHFPTGAVSVMSLGHGEGHRETELCLGH